MGPSEGRLFKGLNGKTDVSFGWRMKREARSSGSASWPHPHGCEVETSGFHGWEVDLSTLPGTHVSSWIKAGAAEEMGGFLSLRGAVNGCKAAISPRLSLLRKGKWSQKKDDRALGEAGSCVISFYLAVWSQSGRGLCLQGDPEVTHLLINPENFLLLRKTEQDLEA